MKNRIILFTIALASTSVAEPRTSADYAIPADTLDFAGRRTASTDYSMDGSLSEFTGTSTNPMEFIHSGFIGQLYDLLGYGLLASDYYPAEGGTMQLIPVRTADDGTNVVIPPTGFSFVPLEGPIPGISATGLVSTSNVYQNTEAIVGATSPQFAGLLTLTLYVQDTIPDNYSTYAGDGLGDDWQFQHFGLDNPLAAPALDPDGDAQNNLFEFTAGLTPTDATSRFTLSIAAVPGEPSKRALTFQPVLAGRTYTVQFRESLTFGDWQPLVGATENTTDEIRTVTDTDATVPARFYRVEVAR